MGIARDETALRAKALGITAPLYKSFPCILDGHTDRARLHPTQLGREKTVWQYTCPELARSVGLGELRALWAYGGDRYVSDVEAARWRERLDYEAGLAWPISLDPHLPDACPNPAAIVLQRMALFIGLRDARWPLDEPFIFSRDFASAYCHLSPDLVRCAVSWLERAGAIYRVGLSGRSILWKLAAQDAYPIPRRGTHRE